MLIIALSCHLGMDTNARANSIGRRSAKRLNHKSTIGKRRRHYCGTDKSAPPKEPAAQKPPAFDPLPSQGPRTQDEFWRISTRDLNNLVDGKPVFAASRYTARHEWESSNIDSLYEASGGAMTIMYVHGYGFDPEKSKRIGWDFYRAIARKTPRSHKLRFIVWSWPSTSQAFRYRADMRDKAKRTDFEACCLAWVLARMNTNCKVSVIGSAMGCRAVSGALHLHSGAKLGGWKWPNDPPGKRCTVRGVLISAALHNDWLYPNEKHDHALAGVERLLLINNSLDPQLSRYALLYSKSNPVALGRSGLEKQDELEDLANRLIQHDAANEIGEHHGVEHYIASPKIMDRLRKFTLWEQ